MIFRRGCQESFVRNGASEKQRDGVSERRGKLHVNRKRTPEHKAQGIRKLSKDNF